MSDEQKPIADAWRRFWETAEPAGLDRMHHDAMQKAFYAGAWWMLCFSLHANTMTMAEFYDFLELLKRESIAFVDANRSQSIGEK